MNYNSLGVIEQKVLGALLILAEKDNVATATSELIAHTMGYKSSGGGVTFALKILEKDNFIIKIAHKKYKVLI